MSLKTINDRANWWLCRKRQQRQLLSFFFNSEKEFFQQFFSGLPLSLGGIFLNFSFVFIPKSMTYNLFLAKSFIKFDQYSAIKKDRKIEYGFH